MPYWVIDLDEKGKPLLFGPFGWFNNDKNYDKAETYKDKNCSRMSRVVETEKTRDRGKAKKELVDEIRDLIADRRAVLPRRR